MSIRAAFGVSAAIGFGLSLGFGAPLAAALIYGALSGAIGAAIYSAPPVHSRIAVVRTPAVPHRPWFGGWFGHSHHPHSRVVHHTSHRVPTGGTRVLPTGPVPQAPSHPRTGGFFGLWGNGRTAGHTSVTPVGHGTRTTLTPSLPTRTPVHHTRMMNRR